MNSEERLDRLERLLFKLTDALIRKSTELDGNWGNPTFHSELSDIKKNLKGELRLPLTTRAGFGCPHCGYHHPPDGSCLR